MSKIQLLDQETIDRIAAGEVVERPCSVVKELVENAIDAGAGAVTIEIKEGGISLIRITDNGCGIAADEVRLAFLRHSTSKIKSAGDLACVQSLGFRGEALSSIAAVARVELVTKTCHALTGTRYMIEGGRELAFEEVGAPDGTTFLVRDLFYNVPARRKFLKTAQTEGSYINDMVEKLALSHPDVSFKYINNNQTRLHTSGNGSCRDIVYHIYGRDITAQLLPVDRTLTGFGLSGYIGKPAVSRGNRNYETFFINGRYVKSSLLSKALEEAYKSFLMQRQYPFTVLYFTFTGDMLDVNVHPSKMELRFFNAPAICSELAGALRETLHEAELIPEVSVTGEKTRWKAVHTYTEPIPEPFEKRRISELRAREDVGGYRAKKTPEAQKGQPHAGSDRPVVPPAGQKPHTDRDTPIAARQTAPHAGGDTPIAARQTAVPAAGQQESFAGSDRPTTGGQPHAGGDRPHVPWQQESHAGSDLPSTGGQQTSPTGRHEPPESGAQPDGTRRSAAYADEPEGTQPDGAQLTLEKLSPDFLTADARKMHRIIGQLFETYWLIEYGDKLYIMDQHAAHEKVLYERKMAQLAKKEYTSQAVSPPIVVSLDARQQEMLDRCRAQLEGFGYAVEHFGGREYMVSAVPDNLFSLDVRELFIDMLDSFTGLSEHETPERISERIASMSCKAAVKGSHRMSLPEVDALVGELLSLDNPFHCPHGRPTIIAMTKHELERKFKRIL